MSYELNSVLIASKENPRFKALQKKVAQPRLLRRDGEAVAEGIHLLQALVQWPGVVLVEIWFASSLRQHREWLQVQDWMLATGVECIEVPPELYERLSELQQGGGPLAVFRTPVGDEPGRHDEVSADPFAPPQHDILLLDGVQDPGNVGALIRTAAAVGIGEIWTTPDCAWVWSGKVLRAAMGGHRHVRLPGLPVDALERVAAWRQQGVPVRLTRLEQSVSLFEADLRTPGVWLLGSEGQGVSPQWASLADTPLRIPMQPGLESLNVGAAAAVCLYEQWRQRAAPACGSGKTSTGRV